MYIYIYREKLILDSRLRGRLRILPSVFYIFDRKRRGNLGRNIREGREGKGRKGKEREGK